MENNNNNINIEILHIQFEEDQLFKNILTKLAQKLAVKLSYSLLSLSSTFHQNIPSLLDIHSLDINLSLQKLTMSPVLLKFLN